MHRSDDVLVLDRVTTPRGELALRRAGTEFEVISNGVFLMDTRDGRSERALVHEALTLHGCVVSLLIGGLGVGFSLLEAVSRPDLERIVVVEIEPRLLDWHGRYLAHLTGAALSDPRVEVVVGDVSAHLDGRAGRYDAVCLDVDNGPDWTVTAANASLYDAVGTRRAVAALAPGGVLAVWSASRSPAYADLLDGELDDVRAVEVPVRLARGEPDVIYLGRRRG